MAARSNNDDWEAIEAAVRAALVDSGLGDLVREVDAAADTSEDEGGAGQRAAYAPRRVFELLAASEGFFAGRAALARSAGQLTDRLGVERLRFVDNDGRTTIDVPPDPEAAPFDEQAAERLRELINRLG